MPAEARLADAVYGLSSCGSSSRCGCTSAGASMKASHIAASEQLLLEEGAGAHVALELHRRRHLRLARQQACVTVQLSHALRQHCHGVASAQDARASVGEDDGSQALR